MSAQDGNAAIRGSSLFERRIEQAALGLIITGIGFLGTQFWNMNNSLIRQSHAIETLQERVTELKTAGRDRYTGADASRDFGRLDTVLSDHEIRIRRLESANRIRLDNRAEQQ